MKRDYDSGVSEDAAYFVGTEIEHTFAFGMRTLFVVGVRQASEVILKAKEAEAGHVYLGANHSFNSFYMDMWNDLIICVLEAGFYVSLDVDSSEYVRIFSYLEKYSTYEKFGLTVAVMLPHIEKLNTNTSLKLDDVTFNATNPGVWLYNLQSLKQPTAFTPWEKYKDDKII